jgi:hypothetical protein
VKWHLLPCLLLLAGCAVGAERPEARVDRKEVFVEVAALTSQLPRLVPFPLAPKDEPILFSSVRSAARGAAEQEEKLAMALGDRDDQGRPRIDRSALSPRDPPALLMTLLDLAIRDDDACYVGHCVYPAGPPGATNRTVVHHVRLLLVNKGSQLQALSGDDLTASVAGPPEQPLPRLAFLDGAGAVAEGVEVPPGEARLVQAFFSADAPIPSLRVRWRLKVGARTVDLDALLHRRYALAAGQVSALEDAVARGLPLPGPRGDPRDPWREPFLEPVAAGER